MKSPRVLLLYHHNPTTTAAYLEAALRRKAEVVTAGEGQDVDLDREEVASLPAVMERADHPRVGTLPDFGNFHLGDGEWYDRYEGVRELMPWARAVSAKSHEFDADGNEVRTDYRRMLQIVLDAGYRGYVGIEYEGKELGEHEGIRLTKQLLERVRAELG